jgi:tetratricopeptide (TPR) repeat protein
VSKQSGRVGGRLLLAALVVILIGIYPVPLVAVQNVKAGDRALEAGDFDAAIAAYLGAVARVPWDPLPLDRAAQAEAAAGRHAEAERDLQRLAEMIGWTAGLHRRLGDVLHARGETEAAVAQWEAAAPADPAALRSLADVYLQAQDWAKATLTLQSLSEVAPGDALALYHLGLLMAPYDPEAARGCLTRASVDETLTEAATAVISQLDALTDEPDRAYANARLALTLMELEELPMAEQALSQAVLLNPRYAEALAYLGLVRDQQGEDGLPAIMEALDLEPESALVRYALGRHYALEGDYSAAIPALIQAAALDPANAAIAAELGVAYRYRGDLSEAERWLRRATELERHNVRFLEQLAAFYADTAYDLEGRGLAAINNAVLRAPNSADIHASLGWALYNVGQDDPALGEMESALELEPANPRALYYYGVLLEVRGDAEGAASAYLNVIEIAPGSGFAALADRALDRLGWAR